MQTIGKAIYNGEEETEVKADFETEEIVQMQPDGVHEGMRWEAHFEDEAGAKENAKTIIEANEDMKFVAK